MTKFPRKSRENRDISPSDSDEGMGSNEDASTSEMVTIKSIRDILHISGLGIKSVRENQVSVDALNDDQFEKYFLQKMRKIREAIERGRDLSPEEMGSIDVVLLQEADHLLNEIWRETRENRELFIAHLERMVSKLMSKKMFLLANLMLFLVQSSHMPKASIQKEALSALNQPGIESVQTVAPESRDTLHNILNPEQTPQDISYPTLLHEYVKQRPQGEEFEVKVPPIKNLKTEITEDVPIEALAENYADVQEVLEQRFPQRYVALTPSQIVGLAYKESSWNPSTTNKHSGAEGYVQLMHQTAIEMMKKFPDKSFDLLNKQDNLYLGLNYIDIKYTELNAIMDRINDDRVEAGKTPIYMHEEDFQALVLASYNAGACTIMGLFEEYIERAQVSNFTWHNFLTYLQNAIDQRQKITKESGYKSKNFLTYPIPEEMRPYVKRKRGLVMCHKVEQFLHYVEYIRAFSGRLEEIESSMLEQFHALALKNFEDEDVASLQLPPLEDNDTMEVARDIA